MVSTQSLYDELKRDALQKERPLTDEDGLEFCLQHCDYKDSKVQKFLNNPEYQKFYIVKLSEDIFSYPANYKEEYELEWQDCPGKKFCEIVQVKDHGWKIRGKVWRKAHLVLANDSYINQTFQKLFNFYINLSEWTLEVFKVKEQISSSNTEILKKHLTCLNGLYYTTKITVRELFQRLKKSLNDQKIGVQPLRLLDRYEGIDRSILDKIQEKKYLDLEFSFEEFEQEDRSIKKADIVFADNLHPLSVVVGTTCIPDFLKPFTALEQRYSKLQEYPCWKKSIQDLKRNLIEEWMKTSKPSIQDIIISISTSIYKCYILYNAFDMVCAKKQEMIRWLEKEKSKSTALEEVYQHIHECVQCKPDKSDVLHCQQFIIGVEQILNQLGVHVIYGIRSAGNACTPDDRNRYFPAGIHSINALPAKIVYLIHPVLKKTATGAILYGVCIME